jgi:hypothetical protein
MPFARNGIKDGTQVAGPTEARGELAEEIARLKNQPGFCGLRSPVDLRLISATPFDSGVVGAVYKAA